jgi:prophage regulatory protein
MLHEATMNMLTFDRLRSRGVPYSRDHLRRLTKAGKFPKPFQLSEGRIAWRESDVDEWLETRPLCALDSSVSPNVLVGLAQPVVAKASKR